APLLCLNAPAATLTSTLSLHDALPISKSWRGRPASSGWSQVTHRSAVIVSWPCGSGSGSVSARKLTRPENGRLRTAMAASTAIRSEEHTSELQSLTKLVCRLLLEKKKQ